MKCRPFMKHDIIKFVKDFHGLSKLNKSITSSFITLMPKHKNPQGLEEFRSICLISPCQTTFVPSRNMLDGVLVTREILDLITRSNKSCMMFKIDFEKA